MPVIIAREDQERWLNEGSDDLLRPCAPLRTHFVQPIRTTT
jgi:hypothetical protein